MDSDTFVSAVKRVVEDAAAEDCIKLLSSGPPGRRPPPNLVELSEWFRSLSDTDRAMVQRVAHEASRLAVFGFLCVLDGARAVEAAGPKGDFELWFVKDGQRQLLNPASGKVLHDIYRAPHD